jgi:hypothetical protein
MPAPAPVLDHSRFEAGARVADVLALGVLLVVGAALVFDMYTFGYSAAQLAAGSGSVLARDQRFVRMLAECALAAAAFCWVAYRLVFAHARRHGG